MQLIKLVTLLGLTGAALAVPNANPEPQRGRQCTQYQTVTHTVTIAPTVTVPVAIIGINRTVNCGKCVLQVRTRTVTRTIRRVPFGRRIQTVIRKSTATTYHPVCRTQAARAPVADDEEEEEEEED